MQLDNILRVELKDGKVLLDAYGLDDKLCALTLPCEIEEHEVPKWLERKLYVLMVMPHEPPTTVIRGVGMRVSEDVFWVYHNGESYGDDTGEESKEPSRQTS
jgi:hypothetical protein